MMWGLNVLKCRADWLRTPNNAVVAASLRHGCDKQIPAPLPLLRPIPPPPPPKHSAVYPERTTLDPPVRHGDCMVRKLQALVSDIGAGKRCSECAWFVHLTDRLQCVRTYFWARQRIIYSLDLYAYISPVPVCVHQLDCASFHRAKADYSSVTLASCGLQRKGVDCGWIVAVSKETRCSCSITDTNISPVRHPCPLYLSTLTHVNWISCL